MGVWVVVPAPRGAGLGPLEATGRLRTSHARTPVDGRGNPAHQPTPSAMDSRHLIGQAQGILMERFQLDDAGAFAVLRRYSQDNNLKLHDVARLVVDTRRLPDL